MCVYCLTFREKGSMQWEIRDEKASSQLEWICCIFSKFSLSLESVFTFLLVMVAALSVITPQNMTSCCPVSFILLTQSVAICSDNDIYLTVHCNLFCFHRVLGSDCHKSPFVYKQLKLSLKSSPSCVHAQFSSENNFFSSSTIYYIFFCQWLA